MNYRKIKLINDIYLVKHSFYQWSCNYVCKHLDNTMDTHVECYLHKWKAPTVWALGSRCAKEHEVEILIHEL